VAAEPAFLVTYPIPEPGMSALRAAGRVHIPDTQPTAEELRDACSSGDFDVVVAQLSDRFDADLLAQAKLTGISNYAVGYDNIDVPAATSNAIVIGNTPGVLTDATADLAMLLILATARRAIEADGFTRSGQFTGWKPDCSSAKMFRARHWASPASVASPEPPLTGPPPSACRSRSAPTRLRDDVSTTPSSPCFRTRSARSIGPSSSMAATFCLCMCRWRPPPDTWSTRPCFRR
jgi:hypothetical protein